jgi:hypothetical protein
MMLRKCSHLREHCRIVGLDLCLLDLRPTVTCNQAPALGGITTDCANRRI